MIDLVVSPFVEFEFMQRALFGCLLLSINGSLIGVFLLLKRMSLSGDAIAHAILPGAAIGYFFAGLNVLAMTVGGLIAGVLVAFLSGITARKTNTSEDSTLASYYLCSLALGVLIISMKGGSVDLLHVLFGSILALDNDTLYLLYFNSALCLLGFCCCYRFLVMDCSDSVFFKGLSKYSGYSHYLFLFLLVFNLVAGFHALGTLMAVGVTVLPAATAKYWSNRIEGMLFIAFLVAVMGALLGLLSSYYFRLPSSSAIVLWLGVFYLLSVLLGTQGGVLRSIDRKVKLNEEML
ncbi:MAG: metal ABC transporter permease [Oceanospirillaceae bacterium]